MKNIWPIVALVWVANACWADTGSMRADLKVARNAVQPHVVSILVVREDFVSSEASLLVTSGSGTVISAAGHIATNAHVTENGKRFKVVMNDKREFKARLVGEDPVSDLAVLKIDSDAGAPFAFATFADTADLEPGDTVLAMGAPWGMTDSVSAGIVNNANRLLVTLFEDEADYEQAIGRGDQFTGRYYAWVQHDAPISPGNSGGPLVDIRGRIVGINTRGSGSNGGDMAFAIPASIAKQVVAALIADGRVNRADFGFNVRSLRNTPFSTGAVVSSVGRGSLAEKAGLVAGDRILAVNGLPTTLKQPEDVPNFRRELAERPVGSSLRLRVQHAAVVREIEVRSTLEEVARVKEIEVASLGLSVIDLTASMARNRFLEAKAAVGVVGVRAGGPAASAQPPVQVGDLLESINAQPLKQAAQLAERAPPVLELNDSLTHVLALSRRGNKMLSVITPAPKRLIPEQPPELSKAWAGWESQPIPAALAARLKLHAGGGFRVTRVYADSPAAKAAIKVGDLIIETNGVAVNPSGLIETVALDQRVRNASLQEPFLVALERDGRKLERALDLRLQPVQIADAERTWIDSLSLVAREMTFYDRVERNLGPSQAGVLIDRVENGGFGGLAHLRSGDLLVRLNATELRSVEGFAAALDALRTDREASLSFLVMRGAETRLLFVDSPWSEKG